MDLRKVQLTGGSSITVTLPKAWVDKANIHPGDIVGCAEQPDGSLVIHAHAKGDREIQKYVVDIVGGESEYIFRKIIAAYLMGYDAIVVTSKKPLATGARLAVRLAVRRIMGLEITEEEPHSITLQDFLDPREFHIDKALRRMNLLVQAMQDEALGTLLEPNADAIQSVADRDDEVDRLYWLISKQYHAMLRDVSYASKMEMNASQALNFLLVARLTERTGDHADRIASQALQITRDDKAAEEYLAVLEKEGRKATDLFRQAFQTFLKRDAHQANTVIDAANAFLKKQDQLLKDAAAVGGEAVSHLAFIIESIGRTAAYAADVCEVAINHKVASPGKA